MTQRKVILISEHTHNLDKQARLVVRSGAGEPPAAIYSVTGGVYLATLSYPDCLEGTFESIAEANKALDGYYGESD